jgi:hypothetical protein
LFTAEALPALLLNLLRADREKNRYAIHEYVFMPDHVHLLLTPVPDVSLEKSLQFIKGGFSFRARKKLPFVTKYGKQETTSIAYGTWMITPIIVSIFGRIPFARDWSWSRVNTGGHRHGLERTLILLRRG